MFNFRPWAARRSALAFLMACVLAAPTIATAQQPYPARAIKIVVPFGAGSGTDVVARVMGDELSKLAHVPVIVENLAGANGILGVQTAARAAPDGYTILMVTGTTQAANLALYKKLPYDPVADFEPIIRMAEAPLVLVVNPDSPYKTVAEFIAAVKSRKQLNFASSSSGPRIAGEMLKVRLNGDLQHVPYKTSPQALTDLMGKQFDFMAVDLGPAAPLIKTGKLRALAVSSAARDSQLPDVPTFAEAGLKDFVMLTWAGVVAPAATPPKIVEQLNGWLRQVMQMPAVRERMAQIGLAPISTTSQEFRAFIGSEIAFWRNAVKDAGIQPE